MSIVISDRDLDYLISVQDYSDNNGWCWTSVYDLQVDKNRTAFTQSDLKMRKYKLIEVDKNYSPFARRITPLGKRLIDLFQLILKNINNNKKNE